VRNETGLLLAALATLALASCAPQVRTNSDFDRLKPRTVLVLPPENTTSNTEVLQKSYPFVFSEMAQRGYYVIAPELALQLFRANKLNDPGQINNLPTAKFHEVFGVDAVLKTKVTEWSSKYVVVSASVNVGFDMTLVDTRSGTVLWSHSRVLSQTPNNGNNNSILGALINAALTAATTPYEPIASDNARFMLSTIPRGPYHAQK
jgi:hypothetical protein